MANQPPQALLLKAILFLFISFRLAFGVIWAEDLPVARSEYQNQLIKEALHKKLYQDRYWRILLHYKKTFFGNWESEADAKIFFNSPHGKYDPKAELVETIKAFFSKPDIVNQEIPPPQCRFIARYHWLDQFLHFDPAKMKKQTCPLFDEWFAMMDPKSVSLIFPSYDLFSPGSMFGHTLLRINSVGNENTSILNYAINYGAVIPEAEENTAIYALRGVFGGYRGYFSSVPYYKKVWEYSDMDFRDIWEFDLFLSRHELERMLRHVWELFFTNFDYYFFKENCSYHLLSLIEAARPDLDLQNNYFLWVIPTDTIRDVVSKPNFKTQKVYRPSRYSKYLAKRRLLAPREMKIYLRVLKDNQLINGAEFDQLSIETKAIILELLIDYYTLQKEVSLKPQKRIIQQKRASLKYIRQPVKPVEFSTPPDLGHGTSKTGVAIGYNSEGDSYSELMVRLSFHDLFDREIGFSPYSGIEFGRTRLRYRNDSLLLNEFTVLDIYSLLGRDEAISPYSWNFRAGWLKDPLLDCGSCLSFNAQGGAGMSQEFNRIHLYQLLQGSWNHSKYYKSNYQLGGGFRFGAIVKPIGRFKSGLDIGYINYVFGEKDDYFVLKGTMRYAISVNNELRLSHQTVKDTYENTFAWNFFW